MLSTHNIHFFRAGFSLLVMTTAFEGGDTKKNVYPIFQGFFRKMRLL